MMFGQRKILDNKYYRWYTSIINNRKNVAPEGYSERHHIVPKCMGGTDKVNNLVSLTAREHFIVHMLLPKFTTGADKHKMSFAAHLLIYSRTDNREPLSINSWAYQANRILHSIAAGKYTKERFSDPVYRQKHAEKIRKSWADGRRDEQIDFMKKNSPFLNPETHKKSIQTREVNGTNIFSISNPMHNKSLIKKKVEKTSGDNHYMKKDDYVAKEPTHKGKNHYSRNKVKIYFKLKSDIEWTLIDTSEITIADALKNLGFSPQMVLVDIIKNGMNPKSGRHANYEFKKVGSIRNENQVN